MTAFLDSVRLHATTGPLATRLHARAEPAAIAWLDALPELVVAACERWSFTPTLAHSAAEPSAPCVLVCTGRLANGLKAVLIVAPDVASAAALRAHTVLHANASLNAYLLDWTPATAQLLGTTQVPSSTATQRR